MMLRPECKNCEKYATLELNGVYYCSKHALEVVRKTTGPVPPIKMIQVQR